jgi:hypothetical protein
MRENVDHISYGEKRGKEIDVCVDGSFFQTRNRWREGTTYNKLKKKENAINSMRLFEYTGCPTKEEVEKI